MVVRSALARRQALTDDSPEVLVADAVADTFNCACQAAGAIAFGKTLAPVPLPGTPYAAAEAAALAAQQILDTITEEHIKEVDYLAELTPALVGVVIITMHLLSGVGPLPPLSPGPRLSPEDLAFFKHCVHDPDFRQYLSISLSWVGAGRRENIIRVREIYVNFKSALAGDWCGNMLASHSVLAATL
jgi:hypothetical protein